MKIYKGPISPSNTMVLKTMGTVVPENIFDMYEAELVLCCAISSSDGRGEINITEANTENTIYQIDLADLEELIRQARENTKSKGA